MPANSGQKVPVLDTYRVLGLTKRLARTSLPGHERRGGPAPDDPRRTRRCPHQGPPPRDRHRPEGVRRPSRRRAATTSPATRHGRAGEPREDKLEQIAAVARLHLDSTSTPTSSTPTATWCSRDRDRRAHPDRARRRRPVARRPSRSAASAAGCASSAGCWPCRSRSPATSVTRGPATSSISARGARSDGRPRANPARPAPRHRYPDLAARRRRRAPVAHPNPYRLGGPAPCTGRPGRAGVVPAPHEAQGCGGGAVTPYTVCDIVGPRAAGATGVPAHDCKGVACTTSLPAGRPHRPRPRAHVSGRHAR